MPRIQIKDQTGRPFVIDSSDPEVLAKWLWETLVRIGPNHIWPTELTMYPLFNLGPAGDVPDWPPSVSNIFMAELGAEKTTDNVRGLIKALGQYADRIEAGQ